MIEAFLKEGKVEVASREQRGGEVPEMCPGTGARLPGRLGPQNCSWRPLILIGNPPCLIRPSQTRSLLCRQPVLTLRVVRPSVGGWWKQSGIHRDHESGQWKEGGKRPCMSVPDPFVGPGCPVERLLGDRWPPAVPAALLRPVEVGPAQGEGLHEAVPWRIR